MKDGSLVVLLILHLSSFLWSCSSPAEQAEQARVLVGPHPCVGVGNKPGPFRIVNQLGEISFAPRHHDHL